MGPVPPESGVRLGLLLRMKKNQTRGARCWAWGDAGRRVRGGAGRPAVAVRLAGKAGSSAPQPLAARAPSSLAACGFRINFQNAHPEACPLT